MTQIIADTPATDFAAVENPLQHEAALNSLEGQEMEGNEPGADGAALETAIGSLPVEASLVSQATQNWHRPLTPEQHEQKILRDRARRAGKAEPVEEMTQAQRDMPYRQRLSARIQADDAARARRIEESQRRRAESKPKAAFR